MKVFSKPEDLTREIDGAWIDYGTEGARFLIARMGNPANRKAYQRAQARFRQKIQKNKMTPDDRIEVMAKTLADSILLDWEGIEDTDGKALDYTPDLAYQVLKYDQDVREFVSEQADLSENFRQEEIEEEAKKSVTGSSGKQKMAAG